MSIAIQRNSMRGNGVEEMPLRDIVVSHQPNGTITDATVQQRGMSETQMGLVVKVLTAEEEREMKRQRKEAIRLEKIRIKAEKKDAKRLEKETKMRIKQEKKDAKKQEKENKKLEKIRMKSLRNSPLPSLIVPAQAPSQILAPNPLQAIQSTVEVTVSTSSCGMNRDISRLSHNGANLEKTSEIYPDEDPNPSEYLEDEIEDDPIDDFVGDFEFSEAGLDDLSPRDNFECLTRDDLIAKQNGQIADVAELLSIDLNSATALLRHFKWNRDRLVLRYFEEPSRVMREAGVVVAHIEADRDPKEEALVIGECTICCDDMDESNSTSNPCGHRFCNDCWREHIRTRIAEGESSSITCPGHRCNISIAQGMIKELIDPELFKRYYTFVTQSFVDQSEALKWCPARNCGNAITAEMVRGQMVTCSCGYTFCFKCQQEAHYPATCDQVRLWQKKIQDESETQNWISANTQDCPKCKSFIEKNGGCNHMTCRVCSYEFCWLCMRDWKGHNDYYSCNRFLKNQKKASKTKSAKNRDKKEHDKAALERYLHFYSRHLNHDRSRAFEKLREEAQRKMQILQETEATAAEVKYIQEASDQLIELRLVLKYSYVVGFYLDEVSPKRNLFEYQQEILEKTAEQLSSALENPEEKIKVMNLTRLARTKISNFVQAASEDEIEK